ncbi:MAG: Bug family tripartite tricarboxylate transporter substrate binding protein [Ramlibacter sp.]
MLSKLLRVTLFVAALLPALAAAQGWPSRPIKLVVPLLAGGSVDQTARFFAAELSKSIGQQVVVENIPGGNGAIGLQRVAQAQPDGYTFAVTANSFQTISPHLSEAALPYDTTKDFTPVAGLVSVSHVVLVKNTLPVNTIPELVALAKRSQPKGLNHGAASATGASYLASLLFRRQANFEMTDVFYKGAAAAYTDLMGGHIDVFFDSLGAAIPLISSGKVKAIATTQSKRHSLTPDVPTVSESFPGFDTSGWYAIIGPASVPADIVGKLNAAVAKVHGSPEFAAFAKNYGYEPMAGSAADLKAVQAKELAQWGEIAKTLKTVKK